MRKTVSRAPLALFLLILAGCVARPALPPATGIALLPSGEPLLRCREACVEQWRAAVPQAVLLNREGRWRELAWLVLSIGYQDDLTLYYLGSAAAGLGYPVGAASYFRQSLELSGTAASCVYASRTCGGLLLPEASRAELAALEPRLHPPRRRALRPRRRRTGAIEVPKPKPTAPGGTGEPVPLSPAAGMPPPPAVPAPAAAPPAPDPTARPVPSGHGAGEFIEPPPAR